MIKVIFDVVAKDTGVLLRTISQEEDIPEVITQLIFSKVLLISHFHPNLDQFFRGMGVKVAKKLQNNKFLVKSKFFS